MKRSELILTFLLLPLDILMILVAFILAYKLRLQYEVVPAIYSEPLIDYLKFTSMFLPVWIIAFALNGLYRINGRGILKEFSRIIVASSSAIALMMVWIFLSRTFFFSRLIIVLAWVLSILMVTFGRLLIRFIKKFLYRYNIGVHRIIILGRNSSTKPILEELRRNRGLGYKIVKVIDEDGIEKIERIVANNPCDEIMITDSTLTDKQTERILEFCRIKRIGFKMTPNLLLVKTSHINIETLAGVPILEFKRTSLDGWGRIFKRIMDIFCATILIILFSPIMFITAILVKLTSKGPILYRQDRVGLEKNFKFLKFRSMKTEYCVGDEYGGRKADEVLKKLSQRNEVDGPVFKIKNDPRVTTFGKFIRKTSIDELPQFFNVLKGNMSLIGPRPPLPEEVAKYNDFQKSRLGVKPGITGLWQVSGRSELSFEEWVKLDAYYIENWSLWLDVQIFLKTILVIIKGRGAY